MSEGVILHRNQSAKVVKSVGTFSSPRVQTRVKSKEDGFTLVELMIVVIILPMIVGALALGLIAVFKLQPGVSGRIADVSDSQVVGTVFQTDIQGATQLTTSNSVPGLCGTGTRLFSLQFADLSVVSYAEVTVGSTQTLQRLHCSSGTPTPDKTTTLSFDLPPSQQAPTISCGSTPGCNLYPSNWISTAGISSVSFTVTEPRSSLNYTLVAVPGLWNNTGGGVMPGGTVFPIVMLSNCSSGPALSLSGNSTLTVGTAPNYSPIQVNPFCTGSSAVSVSNPATLIDSSISKSSTDPLALANAPSNPSTTLTGVCLAGSCSPGDYSTMPTLKNNGTLTFASGTYVFDQPFVIPNGATVTFGDGTIWFKGGLTLNSGTVNFGSGTVLFGNTASNTCTGLACLTLTSGSSLISQSSQGALLYVEQGSANLAAGGTVILNGVQNGGGITNSDLALWDAAASGSNYPLTFNSGSSGTSNGGIYVPTGNVSMAQNGLSSYAYIDAYTLTISNLTTLGVG